MASLVQKLVGISVFASLPFGDALAAEFAIQGLSKPLEKNLEYYLSPLAEVPAENLSISQLSKLVRSALNPFGYYHSELRVQRSKNDLITLGVDVGEVMLVAKSNLVVSGEASNDQDFIELINQAQLKQGQPLLHSEYDTLKRNLISLAQQKGYFRWTFYRIVFGSHSKFESSSCESAFL